MKRDRNNTCGLKEIIEKYRREFRIPENINYYGPKTLIEAERKYIKHKLMNGTVRR
jgi:hypothetical protein